MVYAFPLTTDIVPVTTFPAPPPPPIVSPPPPPPPTTRYSTDVMPVGQVHVDVFPKTSTIVSKETPPTKS
jgi:hypothetical protein